MSSAGSVEFSQLDSSTCRILTVSSSLERAVALIDRVRNLRKPGQPAPPPAAAPPSSSGPAAQSSGLGQSTRIPWTLSNKYYSADVHFAAHTVTGLGAHAVRNVPAVLFVWAKGEAYRDHPEVALAVRVARMDGEGEGKNEDEDEEEEEAEIDEFLSESGFEFIDASGEEISGEGEEPLGSSFSQGIPGLPRVLDALSTIMWPSMQAQTKPQAISSGRRDLDWVQSSGDGLSPIIGSSSVNRGGTREQEIEALARWLEEDDGVATREDPWRSAADASGRLMPASVSPDGGKEFGFDDDFTVFVSAPPGPPEAGPLYLSLGSALDLHEVDEDKAEPAEDEDEDLPTDAEIEATSSRIFGGAIRGEAATRQMKTSTDMAPFDLSRVMRALEGMKAEIASMEDEGERRKAAARAALGLVYGLENHTDTE
ncbi:hypothetical protein C8J57DRAFT_1445663 [Mycena rebaudengoi]|nr:hypothetical protein C8J57DRAFT_1445663 [Mycena rebaudengoi]